MPGKKSALRLDLATAAGIGIAVVSIVGGLVFEKGNIRDIVQGTAALIVIGGTLGAVMVTTPLAILKSSLAFAKGIFVEDPFDAQERINQILAFATKVRSKGLISLENEAEALTDPFLKKALNLGIDGTSYDELACTMELEIDLAECRAEEAAKVFEQGGGYAPTLGIIGAVLGLIQVMKNLANIEEVGHGIAVAFVATVYGVALANVLLLPAAAKIRARAMRDRQAKELTLLGVLGIVEGLNPRILKNKLSAYVVQSGKDLPGKPSRLKSAA